ncbi:MAG: glycosyl hydrolase [Ferruginibacter sp.]|nr:glycosyl hydrolase [Ferruginibacter sp.]
MKNIYSGSLLLLLAGCMSTNPDASSGNIFSTEGKKVIVYTTADSTAFRVTATDTVQFKNLPQPVETQVCVFVDPTKVYQTFLGIGGAITDASAEVFAKLPKEKQTEFLQSYYDVSKGIGYSLARTNINSCDFSSDNYTYVTDRDFTLQSFNVAHDKQFRIPLIKQAIAAAGGELTMFVSPWSPPAWMKDNNDMLHGGKLKAEFYQPWANYYAKFINAYEKEGIPVWGMSVQNEPMATQRWESCVYTAEDERDFLKKYLGPTMEKEGLGDKKIIVWDHNRDLMFQRADVIFNDPDAAKYAWGMGFHWYESWSGGEDVYNNVARVHEAWPEKNLMFTEGCAEKFIPEQIRSWALGERYGRSMINDFNNGTVGWTDWNILLDEQGGPNHAKNFCFAPVHANTKTGELIYTSAYYYIGQFSKFIRPGAKRISSVASRSHLLTTAFLNTDGKIAVVVMNTGNKTSPVNLWIRNKAAETIILPHSIVTMVL